MAPPPSLLAGLVFVAAVAQTALVPLLPRLAGAHGLSDAASAALIAAPGAATFAVAIPAGIVADRLGARRVTLAAGALLVAGLVAQASPAFGWLLAGRLAFGVAYGIVWTTAIAWLTDRGDAARRQAGIVTSAAAGMAAGPAFGAFVAERAGFGAPFLATAAAALALTVLLARGSRHAPAARAEPGAGATPVASPARAGGLAGGAAALALSGGTNAVLQLLVPLQLHRAGASSDDIGLAFSCAAAIYIAISALVGRLGSRAATSRTNAVAAAVLALALFPAGSSGTAVAVLMTLMLTVAPRATLATIAYPLAAGDAARAGIGQGVAAGLLNGAWAGAMVAAPFAAGAISEQAGTRAAWLAMLVLGTLVAAWLLAREVRPAVRAA